MKDIRTLGEGGALLEVTRLMPQGIMKDVERLCRERGLTLASLNEIRLSAIALSSAVISGRSTPLSVRLGFDEIADVLARACEMAVFAHRDDIANGFITLRGGGRVGVCGYAKYDGGRLVGVSSVSALVFRIPSERCDFIDKLYSYWQRRGCSGMLICSRAGVGKTTAIRALAARAGNVRMPRRVVVVDERCEFDPCAYRDSTVDILRGYKRSRGIEIAIRTMSAEILIVDEIGNDEDSEALMLASGAGVSVVATAHGEDIRAVCKKPSIRRLCDASLFHSYAVVGMRGGGREVCLGEMADIE